MRNTLLKQSIGKLSCTPRCVPTYTNRFLWKKNYIPFAADFIVGIDETLGHLQMIFFRQWRIHRRFLNVKISETVTTSTAIFAC